MAFLEICNKRTLLFGHHLLFSLALLEVPWILFGKDLHLSPLTPGPAITFRVDVLRMDLRLWGISCGENPSLCGLADMALLTVTLPSWGGSSENEANREGSRTKNWEQSNILLAFSVKKEHTFFFFCLSQFELEFVSAVTSRVLINTRWQNYSNNFFLIFHPHLLLSHSPYLRRHEAFPIFPLKYSLTLPLLSFTVITLVQAAITS